MVMIKSLQEKLIELDGEKEKNEAAAEEKIQLTKQNEASVLKAKLASAAEPKSFELKLPEELTCKAKEISSDLTISSGLNNNNQESSLRLTSSATTHSR